MCSDAVSMTTEQNISSGICLHLGRARRGKAGKSRLYSLLSVFMPNLTSVTSESESHMCGHVTRLLSQSITLHVSTFL